MNITAKVADEEVADNCLNLVMFMKATFILFIAKGVHIKRDERFKKLVFNKIKP